MKSQRNRLIVNGVDFSEKLTPAEVAARFRVDPKTVTRWAQVGLLATIRTPGGQRRYSHAQVSHLLGIRLEGAGPDLTDSGGLPDFVPLREALEIVRAAYGDAMDAAGLLRGERAEIEAHASSFIEELRQHR